MADERGSMSADVAGLTPTDGSEAPGPLGEQPPEAPALAPAAERQGSIDAMRGFALLGILVMNIPFFAASFYAFYKPTLLGPIEGADGAVWWISHLFFEFKMMTIFSLLFGAGIVMMSERADAKGAGVAGVHYRRMLWLLLIGACHAYLLWFGDILFTYALIGMIVFWFRRWPARVQFAVGVSVIVFGAVVNYGSGWFMSYVRDLAMEMQALQDAGEELPESKAWAIEAWDGMKEGFYPSAETLEEERAAHLGSWWEVTKWRAPVVLGMQVQMFFFFALWRLSGVFLTGMALYKWGVFSAARSNRFYALLCLFGFGVGLPIVVLGARAASAHGFDPLYEMKHSMQFNYFGSLFVAAGHIGAVMLLWKAGALRWLMRSLAAVGRMALSNYLFHSAVCTTIFYGYGFGLWGGVSRVQMMLFVAAIWAFQLIVSPIWLSRFRYGPMEWLWRSLTYWRPQPMLRPRA